MSERDITKHWTGVAEKLLLGRKIVSVKYMSPDVAEEHGWDARGVVIGLDNGLVIYPSQDDEGNGPGALFTTDRVESALPVIFD